MATEEKSLIGAHVPVAGGLATGGLRYAAGIGAEAIQVFVSNPRGWAMAAGRPAEDERLRAHSEQHGMPVMAYSPLGGPGTSLLRDPTLARIGAARGCSAAAVALAWTIRSGHVIAIPESGSVAHVKENAVALSLTLTPEELQALDAAQPPPSR